MQEKYRDLDQPESPIVKKEVVQKTKPSVNYLDI